MELFAKNAPRAGSDSMKWSKYPSDVLPMWVADMDFPAADSILRAVHERVDHGVFGYSLPSAELLETTCEYFSRKWSWKIDPDWIVVSPGLGVALHTVCRMQGLATGNILVPRPIYTVFRNAPGWAGRKRIDVDFVRKQDQWILQDPEAAASSAGGADVLMLCNPHNPNGKIFSRDELEQLAQLAEKNNWIICSDEVHADLILDENREHIPIASLDPQISKRTITMQSPSKAFNIAGLNFAVVVIEDESLRERYRLAARGQVIDQLNPLGMAAAQAAWNGSADAWLNELIVHLRANRDAISATCAGIAGIDMPQLDSTYLAWLDVSALNLAKAPEHFAEHSLAMSPGAQYGDTSYMRLNFGTDAATVEKACKCLASAAASA